jgi:hypothetical protein
MGLVYILFLAGGGNSVLIAESERFDTILDALRDLHKLLAAYDSMFPGRRFEIVAVEKGGEEVRREEG